MNAYLLHLQLVVFELVKLHLCRELLSSVEVVKVEACPGWREGGREGGEGGGKTAMNYIPLFSNHSY